MNNKMILLFFLKAWQFGNKVKECWWIEKERKNGFKKRSCNQKKMQKLCEKKLLVPKGWCCNNTIIKTHHEHK